jgi:hypothetical protein
LPIDSKRSLSHASEALLTSSRRKISLLEYSEWIMRCSSCFTSAWNPSVCRLPASAPVAVVLMLVSVVQGIDAAILSGARRMKGCRIEDFHEASSREIHARRAPP